MRTSSRFRVAAFHCLLSLAALSCKTYVASGLPMKAADGDEYIRADPTDAGEAQIQADGLVLVRLQHVGDSASAAEAGRVSVNVDADGPVLGRRHAQKGDGHDGNFDDDDVPDDALAVRRLIEDGSAGVSEHAKFDSNAAAKQKLTRETWEDVLTIFCVIFMILGAIAFLVFLCFFNKKQQLEAQQPAEVLFVSQPVQVDDDKEDVTDSPRSTIAPLSMAEQKETIDREYSEVSKTPTEDPTKSKASTIFAY